MRRDIVTALDYFKRDTSVTAVFIYLQEEAAYLLEENDITTYGFMPTTVLEEFIERVGSRHRIQVISQCDENGNYMLPDIELLESEKEIDY